MVIKIYNVIFVINKMSLPQLFPPQGSFLARLDLIWLHPARGAHCAVSDDIWDRATIWQCRPELFNLSFLNQSKKGKCSPVPVRRPHRYPLIKYLPGEKFVIMWQPGLWCDDGQLLRISDISAGSGLVCVILT